MMGEFKLKVPPLVVHHSPLLITRNNGRGSENHFRVKDAVKDHDGISHMFTRYDPGDFAALLKYCREELTGDLGFLGGTDGMYYSKFQPQRTLEIIAIACRDLGLDPPFVEMWRGPKGSIGPFYVELKTNMDFSLVVVR